MLLGRRRCSHDSPTSLILEEETLWNSISRLRKGGHVGRRSFDSRAALSKGSCSKPTGQGPPQYHIGESHIVRFGSVPLTVTFDRLDTHLHGLISAHRKANPSLNGCALELPAESDLIGYPAMSSRILAVCLSCRLHFEGSKVS